MVHALESSKRVLGVVGIAALLVACVAAEQRQVLSAAAQIKADVAQLNEQCRANMAVPDVDPIRGKIELDRTDWSGPTPFSMLTNNDRPTALERDAIGSWGRIRDACEVAVFQYPQTAPNLPAFSQPARERVVSVGEKWTTAGNSLAAELYDGRIGYADYNKRRVELNASGNNAVQAWYAAMLTGGNPSIVGAAQLAEESCRPCFRS
jgi:hypothetical protein